MTETELPDEYPTDPVDPVLPGRAAEAAPQAAFVAPPRPRLERQRGPAAITLREPPHSVDLERAILAVLLDGRHPVAMLSLRSENIDHALYFFQRDHRIVYAACLELSDADQRVDAGSVADLLGKYRFGVLIDRLRQAQSLLDAEITDGFDRARMRALRTRTPEDRTAEYDDSALAALGGFSAIAALQEAYGSIAAVDQNARLLKDYFQKRRLIQRLSAISDQAFRTPETAAVLLDQASRAMLELGKGAEGAAIHTIGDTVDRTMERIQESISNPDAGVRTGIDDLDKLLMALRPGGLYVLAARPGVGKTSFALKVVGNVCCQPEARHRVLFVSLEVDRVDLLKKLFSAEAGIDFERLERGQLLEPHELETLAETSKRLADWPLDLMDVSDLTVHALRSAVKRRALDGDAGCAMVVVDYLQLLKETKRDMTEYEKVSEISRVLKVMARELKIPVVALSQMSRDSEKGATDQSRPPKLSDLRGSGSIEQDADAVIFLHRVMSGETPRQHGEDEARRIEVIVSKNRFGPQGKCAMNFFPSKMRFSPAAPEERPQEEDTAVQGFPSRKERLVATPNKEEDLF